MVDWPVFVLTLPGDDARRAPLMAQLDASGVRAQLIFGVDGRRGLPAGCEAEIDRDAARIHMGRNMTDGEFACALSHRAIYRRVLDEGLPGAIILEDDAILQPGFDTVVREPRLAEMPLVLMDYAYGRALPLTGRPVGSVTAHRVALSCTMANAYFISATGAAALLRASTPVTRCADWPCCLYGVKAWMLSPRLVGHQPPGDGRVSHLDAGRDAVASNRVRPGRPAGSGAVSEWVRRRISVRVGREKGQR
ncbi:glycosyltransferase family 25 protein [Paracoccus hibiscisoli]|nr:glycosyltransferase family 25 protein [Paracoccus hibiscisoli]